MTGWYALVDAAQDSELLPLIRRCKEQNCLFSGDVAPVLAAASPHLVKLDENEPLLQAWREKGRGRHWGLFIEAELPLHPLRRHFKKFLNAKLPDGTVALFRFYDPRVFNTYIRACTPEEAGPWFDGVRQYSVEGEAGAIHNYRFRGGRLLDGDMPAGA